MNTQNTSQMRHCHLPLRIFRRKTRLYLLLPLLCMTGSALLFAQPATLRRALTLERVVTDARKNSLNAQIAENSYIASYWQYLIYKADRYPTLSLRSTPVQYYQNFVKRYNSQNDIDIYKQQKNFYSSFGIQAQQKIRATGGTLYAETDLDYLRSFGADKSTQFSSVPFRIGYSQELFGFNAYKWSQKTEPLRFEKARCQLIYEFENVSAQAVRNFFTYALCCKNVELAQANVARCDTAFQIAQERQQLGNVTQADVLTLQLNLLNARKELNTAQTALEQSGKTLAAFLRYEGETDFDITLPHPDTHLLISPDDAVRMAKTANPKLKELELQRLSAEQNLRQAEKSRFSTSLSVSVGFNQAAETFLYAYRHPLRQDMVSVSLRIPIVDWGANKAKVAVAKSNLSTAQISIQQEMESFEQSVYFAIREYNDSYAQIGLAEEALHIAQLAYDATYERFLIGKANVDALNMAQNRQSEAQRSYINALSTYWANYYEVRKYTLYDFAKKESITVDVESLR